MGYVTLVSGGIDSIVMCKFIEEQGDNVIPLYIDYGQRAAKKEWDACQTLLNECKLPKPVRIDLSGYGRFFPSGLTSENLDIYKDAFLPGRNMLFLLVGASYAYIEKEKTVAIGLLSEELHLFPDQTEEFIANANFALNSALGKDVIIITPLINFNKNQVIKLAQNYKIPLNKTYSCHAGKDKYCSKCVACKEILDSGGKEFLSQFDKGD